MEMLLVGIDGSPRGEQALKWATLQASRRGARLTLVTAIDNRVAAAAGITDDQAKTAAADVLEASRREVVEAYPALGVETRVVFGEMLHVVVEAATDHDLVVLGSHHGKSIGESISGAKGLRVALSTTTPTAVIPVDWSADAEGSGIAVGVAIDDSSDAAIEFACREALQAEERLELISTWGLPAFLSKPAKAMGGELVDVGAQFCQKLDGLVDALREKHPGLDVSRSVIEAPSPTRAILEASRDYEMLVLGAHDSTALGRTLFGSVTHSVLMNLEIPTIVVSR